jgi:uncharacterized membrane protein YciS (DUF1049 family)
MNYIWALYITIGAGCLAVVLILSYYWLKEKIEYRAARKRQAKRKEVRADPRGVETDNRKEVGIK